MYVVAGWIGALEISPNPPRGTFISLEVSKLLHDRVKAGASKRSALDRKMLFLPRESDGIRMFLYVRA